MQSSFQDVFAQLSTPRYNLTQLFQCKFLIDVLFILFLLYCLTKMRSVIIQGKDVNLAALLHPSPANNRQMVDCGHVAVFLKTSDPRLQHNLSFSEFVIAFGIYRDIIYQAFPDRKEELDLYLAMMADFNQRYGDTLLYEYHRSFSENSASFITLFNTRLD